MKDIVERLQSADIDLLWRDAIAEIERLRSLLATSEMTAAEIMADNERLREALRALHEEFAANFPAGENVAVDYAREVLGIKK